MNNKDNLKAQHDLVRSMKDEGLLNDQFGYVYALKKQSGPFFLRDLIPNFMRQSHATIRKLSKALEDANVNITALHTDSIKIKGCSQSFGAGRMGLASNDLYHGVLNGDREACVLAVARLREEYSVLRGKLQELLELESRIITQNDHFKK